MTDTPLLRLARLTLRLAGDATGSDADSLNLHAALFDLVRDLEAAPPPEPARRTITREEFEWVRNHIENWGDMPPQVLANDIAAAWRLTVEDA